MVFPVEAFFDSAYHLRGRSVIERTDRVMDAILSHDPDIRIEEPG